METRASSTKIIKTVFVSSFKNITSEQVTTLSKDFHLGCDLGIPSSFKLTIEQVDGWIGIFVTLQQTGDVFSFRWGKVAVQALANDGKTILDLNSGESPRKFQTNQKWGWPQIFHEDLNRSFYTQDNGDLVLQFELTMYAPTSMQEDMGNWWQ